MKLGLYMRNMGDTSTREIVRDCALGAEAAGIDDLWFADHIAIPPDDAEGSNGRYLDPLATIAWLAGATERIHLGTGVLILPYRPALPTAKWIATIQELSGGRMLLGVGIGWMDAEFRAVGIPRSRRGAQSDETLEFFEKCFAEDEVVSNGQPMLFRPRPPKPPLFVGGGAPYATKRAARFGGGWMPMGADPEKLAGPIADFRRDSAAAGHPDPEIVLITGLDVEDTDHGVAQAEALRAVGATRIVQAARYAEAKTFVDIADRLAKVGARLRG
ncbi:MAG: TIGR03619 family F420-dependent LLM class oxidoreductase [Candidatus Binatia bacterium]|nr:TIGR03619 family F420-dependent LLM class oxidoreductase [Candidatus Binatia bacterium]